MSELLAGFERYLLHGAQATDMRARFSLVLQGANLTKDARVYDLIAAYDKVPGIYFWIMCSEGAEYKIYIGQTSSFSYRVSNYLAAFQPHSPNDYKLQIFVAFVAELLPAARLDLYFAPAEVGTLNPAEKAAIAEYNPLLNKLPRPTPDARAKLQIAFSAYYRSAFERRLRG